MQTRVAKILRGLGLTLLGLVVLAGLLWVLRVPLFGGLVKRELASRLGQALGGRYEIEDVGGSWLGGLTLEGLRTVVPPPAGPLAGLTVRRAEVDYDLVGLLGDAPLAAIERILVDGARVELDLARPAAEGEAEPPDLSALDGFRAEVDVRADLVVETGAGAAIVRGLRAGFGAGRPLRVDVEEIDLPAPLDVRGPFAGRVARVDADTWRWTSEAELAGVRVPEATIRRDGGVTATVELAGGRVVATSDAERASARLEALDLARLPAWLADRIPGDAPRPTSGIVRGTVAVPWGAEPFGATFDLAADGLVWADERIESATLRGTVSGGRVTLAALDVAGGRLRARGADVLLDLAVPIPLRGARSLEVEVDSLRALVPDLAHDVSVALRASGPEPGRLAVDRLVVRRDDDRLEARGTVRFADDPDRWRRTEVELALEGVVADPTGLSLPWTGAVRVAGSVSGALDALALDLGLDGEAIAVEGRPVEGARLAGTLSWPRLDVSTLEVRAPGLAVVARGAATLEPLAFQDATWRLQIDDLARVAPLLPPDAPALGGRLTSDGRLAWDGATLSGSATLAGTDVRVDGEVVGSLQAAIEGRGDEALRVTSLAIEGPRGRLRASGSADLRAGRATVDDLTFGTDADGPAPVSLRAPLGVRWDAGEVRLAGADLEIDGVRVRFDASARPEAGEATVLGLEVEHPEARLRLAERLDLAWREGVETVPGLTLVLDEAWRVGASARVDVRAESATVEALVVAGPDLEARLLAPLGIALRDGEILVTDLDASVRDVRVRGTARVDPEARTAVVDALRVESADLDARLAAPARLAWTDAAASAEGLDVAVLGGRVLGRASWDGAAHADLEVRGLALSRWVDGLDGALGARVRVDGARLAVEADVGELAFRGWRGTLRVVAAQDETGPLRVERIRLGGPRGGALEGEATLPWRLSTSGLATVEDARSHLALRGRLGGLDDLTDVADGPVRVEAVANGTDLSVRILVADVGLCDASRPCDDVALELRVTPDAVRGRVALGSDAFLRLRGHVDLDRGFDWTRPETVADLVGEATIDAEIDALVESWAPLAEFAPGLRRLEGGTRARLRAAGPLRSPAVEGELVLSQVGIELDTDVAPFEQVDARIVWQDDRIRVERFEGLMGYAPFRLQGDVRLVPDGLPVLDLTLHGRNTQLIRTEWFRLRIDVDARITGPVDRMHVAGEGRIVDSIYREPVSLTGAAGVGESPELMLFEIEDAPFDRMTFDLGVVADDTIRIRNNLLRVNVSYEGRLRGTGARPAFEGRAWFRRAEIRLPLTTLREGKGDIEFLPGSPGQPRIQMTARTRTKGYEMGVQLAGRLPDVNLQVFTEPPLPDEDAMLMLATGSTGAELAQGGIVGTALAGVLSVFGGSLFESRGDGREPGEKAFFERFDIQADLDGTTIQELDAEVELDRRFYLHVKRDRFEATNLGLIWRIRFR